MMKAVITDAGQATRMRPASNVVPKTLMPLFRRDEEGNVATVPFVDWILEQFSKAGVDDVCVVTGRNGNLIRDYLSGGNVHFVTQEEPIGFGDAVYRAKGFVAKSPFILNAGDIAVLDGLKEAVEVFNKKRADCVLLVRVVDDPSKYGVVTVESSGMYAGHRIFAVTGAKEKPKKPKSNYAIVGVYVFRSKIFDFLREGDKELTPAIQQLIKKKGKVYAVRVENQFRINAGNPQDYHDGLNLTFTRR